MSDAIDAIYDAIEEVDRADLRHNDWPVYVPTNMLPEIKSYLSERTPIEAYNKGITINGKGIIPDPYIESPVVLPKEPNDVPYHHAVSEDPPEQLVKRLIALNLDARTPVDTVHDTVNYTTKLFFEVANTHQRTDQNTIDKYALTINDTTIEYDKQPDELECVKLGCQFTNEFTEHIEDDFVEQTMVDGVRNTIHSVHRQPVYGTRKRVVKGPYPVLDIHHTERIRCGTRYKHYGGVFLAAIDTPAQKMDIHQANGFS
jgi:hypothetical protein